MKLSIFALVAILVVVANTTAAAFLQESDSVMLKNGEVYLVHSYILKNQVQFVMYTDSVGKEICLPLSAIKEVAKHDLQAPTPPVDPYMKAARQMHKTISIGLIMLVSGIFTPIGLVLLGIGFVKSEQLLRQLKNRREHPAYLWLRKKFRSNILLIWLVFFLTIMVYLLFII